MSSDKIETFKKQMNEMLLFADKMCKPHHVDYSIGLLGLLNRQSVLDVKHLKNEIPNNKSCKDDFQKYKECYISSVEYYIKQFK